MLYAQKGLSPKFWFAARQIGAGMLQNMQCTVTLLWSAIVILNLFKFIIAILKLQIRFSFIVVVRALMWHVQSLFYLLKNVTDSR